MATIYLYPVWLRLWHLFNAILCLLLIVSGISLQYSSPELYLIRFDLSVSIHNVSGVLLSLSYVMFIVGNIVTPNGRFYKIKRKGLIKDLFTQLKFYTIGLFKKENPPFPVSEKRKFNPLQLFSYVVIMYVMMAIIFITGWSLFFPELIINTIFGWSGLHIYALSHIISGFIISIFMIVHIYFCTIGAKPSSNFVSIITGWHKSA